MNSANNVYVPNRDVFISTNSCDASFCIPRFFKLAKLHIFELTSASFSVILLLSEVDLRKILFYPQMYATPKQIIDCGLAQNILLITPVRDNFLV